MALGRMPSGRRIALLNDAALGVAPEPEELFAYARRLDFDGSPAAERRSDAAGIDRLSAICKTSERWHYWTRCPIGPDYLPGHAHADTLSFEL